MNKTINRGFTLVEVLLALAVVAIALTALLKATSQDVANTQRIKEKTISHWIAMHGIAMVQLGLLTVPPNQEITQVTSLLGQRWYWRVKLSPTTLGKAVQQMTVSVSKNQAGPFTDPLLAFKYQP
nr:GspI family T2SS minor pseudopilin variant LspI [Legionella rubrilucens]